MAEMDVPILSARTFAKRFNAYKTRTVQVSERGRLIGIWMPAASQSHAVDFAARAAADSAGQTLPFTFSKMLNEHKKR
jgi:hypothetical protein